MTPFEMLVTLRAAYGAFPTPAEKGILLNRLAWEFRDEGMALLGKPGGNNVPTPSGALVSSDFLVHVPSLTGHDVLTGNDQRDAIPVAFEWGEGPEDLHEMLASHARSIVFATDPGGAVDPPGPPAPAPGDPNLEPRIVRLEAEIAAAHVLFEEAVKQLTLVNKLQADQGAAIGRLDGRIIALEVIEVSPPAPPVVIKKPNWWPW